MDKKITNFFVEWGKITYDGSETKDILFIDGKVIPRNYDKLNKKYGTVHVVDLDEAKDLLKGNPWEVVIGAGFEGLLKVNPDAESILKQRTALIILPTPDAVKRINERLGRGEKVNALVHVTC